MIYRIKITLKGIRPPIWRRVEVEGGVSLHVLHKILNAAMGWTGTHLYDLRIGDSIYSYPDDGMIDDFKDSQRFRLDKTIAREKTRFQYTYDFGDGWEHDVVVEEIMPPEPGAKYPRCTAGARACPPEDCGGDYGYLDMLEALRDTKHERHDEIVEWLGEDFDPEAFDVKETDEIVRYAPRRVEFH